MMWPVVILGGMRSGLHSSVCVCEGGVQSVPMHLAPPPPPFTPCPSLTVAMALTHP
jgi:hypothetical protein